MTPRNISDARIRAAWCKKLLAAVRAREADGQAILASVPEGTLDVVEGASRVAWIPASDHLGLMRCVFGAVGETGFRALLQETTVGAVRSPFLSKFLPALDIFGRKAMVHYFPKIWLFVTKGYGEVRVTQNHDLTETRVVFFDLPRDMATLRPFQLSTQAVLEGAMSVAGLEPNVELDVSHAESGEIECVMRAPIGTASAGPWSAGISPASASSKS